MNFEKFKNDFLLFLKNKDDKIFCFIENNKISIKQLFENDENLKIIDNFIQEIKNIVLQCNKILI